RLLSYRPFPVELLAEPYRSYVSQSARAIGCDAANVALPLLTAAAEAVGNSRSIQLKETWQEPCILWSVLISESGHVKSPGYDQGMAPLQAIEDRLYPDWQKKLEHYESELAQWKKDKEGDKPKRPECQRVIVDDITLETLVQKLRGAPRGLLLASDELAAWLTSFNQYKPRGRGADEARWLSMHRGAPLRWDRKSAPESDIYVKRASVSATGTIQPGTMKWAFTKQYRENGLLARFLLAMPTPRKREWTEYVLEQGLSDRVHSCFERLYQLEFAQSMPGKPIALPLTAAAKAAWIKFVNQHGE